MSVLTRLTKAALRGGLFFAVSTIALSGASNEARAQCVYLGGFPWQSNGCLTANDLNAAFNRAYAPPSTLATGAAAANLGYMPLNPANNLQDVANPATALANLGGIGLNSPAFTGTPTAPTPALSDATTKLATTAYVKGQNYFSGGAGSITASMLASGVAASNLGYTPLNKASNLSDVASLSTAQANLFPAGSIVSSQLAAGVAVANLGYTPLRASSNLSDVTNVATARGNLGLNSMATQGSGAVAITGGSITGLPTPVNPTDAAIKSYVDSAVSSAVSYHTPAALATAFALPANTYSNGTGGVGATLTATANAALTVDGTAVSSGQRILVKNEATAANDGVYTVTATGSGAAPYVLTRATDFNSSSNITTNSYFLVSSGSVNVATAWVMTTTGTITVGTTSLTFTQTAASQSYAAGTGLQLIGSTFSVPSGGISSSLLASGVAAANLGYTPLNPASNLSDLSSLPTARTNLLPSGSVIASMLASGAAASNLGYTPLNSASNLSDVPSPSTARGNLGLGAVATLGVGTGLSSGSGNLNLASGAAVTNLGFTPANVANNLSDLANTTTARTNLGLLGMAQQAPGSVAITGGSISGATVTGLPTPALTTDAATKIYVDAAAHATVAAATTTTLPANTYANGSIGVGATLTATANGALTVDGYAAQIGDRILVQNEGTASHNGVYSVTVAGSGSAAYVLTRALDFNQSSNILPFVEITAVNGTANAGVSFLLTTTGAITVGTTSLTFAQPTLNASNFPNAAIALGILEGGTPTTITTTGSFTVTSAQTFLNWNPGTPAATTFTLPASPVAGERHTLKDLCNCAFAEKIAANSGQNIDGNSYWNLVTYNDSLTVKYGGSNTWNIVR